MTPATPTREATALMGDTTASATHDLMNVLAIINEHAGLLSDLLHLGGTPSPEHLEKSIAAIGTQVARGRTLLTHLNRFAHAPDQTVGTADVGIAIEEIVTLTQRRFHGRLVAPPPAFAVTCDPVRLRLLIYEILGATCHPTLEEETPVTFHPQGETLAVTFQGHRPLDLPGTLVPLAEQIGAALTGTHHTLSLTLTDVR